MATVLLWYKPGGKELDRVLWQPWPTSRNNIGPNPPDSNLSLPFSLSFLTVSFHAIISVFPDSSHFTWLTGALTSLCGPRVPFQALIWIPNGIVHIQCLHCGQPLCLFLTPPPPHPKKWTQTTHKCRKLIYSSFKCLCASSSLLKEAFHRKSNEFREDWWIPRVHVFALAFREFILPCVLFHHILKFKIPLSNKKKVNLQLIGSLQPE